MYSLMHISFTFRPRIDWFIDKSCNPLLFDRSLLFPWLGVGALTIHHERCRGWISLKSMFCYVLRPKILLVTCLQTSIIRVEYVGVNFIYSNSTLSLVRSLPQNCLLAFSYTSAGPSLIVNSLVMSTDTSNRHQNKIVTATRQINLQSSGK